MYKLLIGGYFFRCGIFGRSMRWNYRRKVSYRIQSRYATVLFDLGNDLLMVSGDCNAPTPFDYEVARSPD